MKVSRRDNLDRYYLVQAFGFGLFLHRIHHDESDTFHTHPWDGCSLIFGSYLEERMGQQPVRRRFLNYLKATTPHRITLPWGPVWTLFLHFRRKNRWVVFDRQGQRLSSEPWRGVGGPTSYAGS